MSDDVPIAPSDSLDVRPDRQILVLHGGGYRGLYTARVLEKIEAEIGRPILDSFDLVAGTSIGGIIAMALADGLSAREIRLTFEAAGSDLFPVHGWLLRKLLFVRRFFRPPHNQDILRLLVEHVLTKGKALEQLPIPIVIPACDAAGDSEGPIAVVYGNHSANPHASTRIEDVALATSAAPTYFASYQLPDSSQQLVDGGVIANSPSWIAMTVAVADYGWDIDHLKMLIIGTTHSASGKVPKRFENVGLWRAIRHPIRWSKRHRTEGFFYWLRKGRLLSLIMDGQQRLADDMCQQAMNKGYCLSINSIRSAEQDKVASALNQASPEATDTLKVLADRAADDALTGNSSVRQMLNRMSERQTTQPVDAKNDRRKR